VADAPVSFAPLLRGLRVKAGMTQEELAESAGVSPRSVSDLERGAVSTPQKDTVRLLAQALQLSGSALVEFEVAARGHVIPRAGGRGPAAATRTLPRDIASFTGRRHELNALADAVAGAGGVVSIHAIGGMPGVGKTAFAVHAAHALAGRHPGGQVFLPLHGHTPGRPPVSPADALASLLLTIGVPAGQIPADLEARAGLWRDRAARRRLLLVLDDAADSEQVRPLLPGAGGSVVLITSRRRLTALDDATTISLDTLPPDEAAELLVRLAVRPGLSSSDPGVREIIRLCGCLPLAIAMVARQLYHHPAWTVADRAAELAAAVDRLAHLATENLSAAAAFDLSYQDLTAAQQRLFRRLAVHPGTHVDAYAAAALDGTGLTATRQGLEALYEHYVLAEPAPGRYRMHDLIAEHAAALTARFDPAGDRLRAAGRLLDYYQHLAALAEALICDETRPARGPTVGAVPPAVPVLGDAEQALAWLRTERASLLACLDQVTATGQHARVVDLTAGLASLLLRDGPWDEAITRHAAAIQAAQETGDRPGRAAALTELGDLRHATGDTRNAVRDLNEALGIWRTLGDRVGEARALRRRGSVRSTMGDLAGAVEDLQAAIDIAEDIGDRRAKAWAQAQLAEAHERTADYAIAARELGEALNHYRDAGDRWRQAQCLHQLGDVRARTGDYPAAERDLQEALHIYRDMGDKPSQAATLNYLGRVRLEIDDELTAARHLQEALEIHRDIGHLAGQAVSLGYRGRLHVRRGEYPAAAEHLHEALEIFREIGDRGSEAGVLNDCGTLNMTRGELNDARSYHQQALGIARQIGDPRGEATALAGLARCDRAAGNVAAAVTGFRQALAIFQRTGAAESARVAAELNTLTSTPGKEPGQTRTR
jgi:tetratricopeptide (TPR) repeat protein/transcriptional regulator with XRE-family HTH domain